jgi:hypothetical protein
MARNNVQSSRIHQARKHSMEEENTLLLDSPKQREFFRFDKGMLVEYDLTKSAGRNIKLTSEELEVINS